MTWNRPWICTMTEFRILLLIFVISFVVVGGFPLVVIEWTEASRQDQFLKQNTSNEVTYHSSRKCQGLADCFDGLVTDIIDGDTIDVNSVRIRLALVDAPEVNETGFSEARNFVESKCGIGILQQWMKMIDKKEAPLIE